MEFTLKLTEQEVNLVLNALQEIPAKVSNPLTKKIFDQAKEQMPQEAPQQ